MRGEGEVNKGEMTEGKREPWLIYNLCYSLP